MGDRIGDWCQTATGKRFWPLDPRPEEVDIEDIAHALSLVCRFGGHCREFYSVAQHSVLVASFVERQGADHMLALVALLHDAAEAYVGDMVRPLKRSMPAFSAAEDRVVRAIERRFGLECGVTSSSLVKRADEVLLATEARDIMGGQSAGKWSLQAAPLPGRIVPIGPVEAKAMFMRKFAALVALAVPAVSAEEER